MSKQRTRNLKMVFSPDVDADTWNHKIRVKTGGWSGNTKNQMTGELSVYCAVQLVRDLRRALRKIRDEETARLNQAVQSAEGDL